MTPFGERVRTLRRRHGVSLKRMAGDLALTPAYLSALEHGHRGRPSEALVVQVCEYFNLIWDDYEEMQRLALLSHPRVVVDTAGLAPQHTLLANELAGAIRRLAAKDAEALRAQVAKLAGAAPPPRKRARAPRVASGAAVSGRPPSRPPREP
ncbi:MAG: helix-turn-helix transcriptional regulator [Alphaproteobacteria bacterium]